MELWELGATKLADAIKSRKYSCREVIEAHLKRIDETNPSINAITMTLSESALRAADETDRKVARGEVTAFCGVPFTVKENQDVRGSATTHGLIPLKNAIASADAPHIAELRRAGAIPIARTNMPEFGMRWHTSNGLHGPTLNPRDKTLTAGGSSGGEAAAIASGMSPLGIGNDGAGSLRWPAQCCGVAALKPSHGRIPLISAGPSSTPLPFAFQLLGTHGPMARCIDDLELAFTHMCMCVTGDPWHVPSQYEPSAVIKPLRIGLADQFSMDAEIRDALSQASDMLRDAGHIVETVELPELGRAGEIYTQIMSRFGRLTAEVERAPVGVISEEYDRFWAAFHEPWENATGKETHDPMMTRGTIFGAWFEMMTQTPIILAPIATMKPWKVGSDLDKQWLEEWLVALRTTTVVNLLGLPSVAIPVTNRVRLPQTVQLIGPRFREDLCLALAKDLESRRGIIMPSV